MTSPRILVIDNHDSFTYNLVQAFRTLGAEVQVHRNDAVSAQQALACAPSHIVISPGPGRPHETGISWAVIERCLGSTPILGVCLGHQLLVERLGGTVGPAQRLMHGKSSPIMHDGRGLYVGLPHPFVAGRYHSLAATTIPESFEVSAWTADGEVMGVRHRRERAMGVQFHPESVLTPLGDRLLGNFLAL